MTNAAVGRAARPRPDAPLRRRDVRDGVGAHRGIRPGHRRAGRAHLERRDGGGARVALRPRRARRAAPRQRRHLRGARRRRARLAATRDAAQPHPHARPDPRAALRVRHLPHHRLRTTPRATRRTASTRCAPWPWRCATTPRSRWPDVLLLLGDQVYADTTPHAELEEFMAARRSLDEPPGLEIKDFVEYAELYRLAWSEEVIRWVLSTVPSAMIFDDHDIRDDWNTSWSWQREIRATTWWQERIVSGLGSYWLHQHLGNLSPAELAQEEVWRRCVEHEAVRRHRRARPDRATSTRSRPAPTPTRRRTGGATPARSATAPWSSSTRGPPASCGPTGARCSTPTSCAGSTACCSGGVRHLFIGTSLPFLLPPGLHDFEAMDEALAQGAYGRTRGPGRREAAAQHRPRALGRLQRGLRRAVRAGHAGGPRRARPGAADDHLPLRRRAQLLPRRGHRPVARWGRSRGWCRRCAHRSATRCRAACGCSCRCSRSRWCGRCGSSRLASPDGARAPTTRGRSPTGPGSTTTSRWSPSGRRGPRADLGTGVVEGDPRPPAAAAGVCRAPRPAARDGSGSASGTVQG